MVADGESSPLFQLLGIISIMAMIIGYDTYGLLTVLTHYSSRKETFLSYVLTGFNPVVFVFNKVSLFFNEKPLEAQLTFLWNIR